jgi:hypothetical protein
VSRLPSQPNLGYKGRRFRGFFLWHSVIEPAGPDPLHHHPRERGLVPRHRVVAPRPAGARASANFVVSRTGHVQELVPLHDIAWHAGNWAHNVRSVGIENEGYTGSGAGFSLPESARPPGSQQ